MSDQRSIGVVFVSANSVQVVEELPVVYKERGDDRILFHQSVPALALRQTRPSGGLPVREGLALVSAAGFKP